MPENSMKCTGCKEVLQEFQFKAHIRQCQQYDGFLLRSSRKLSDKLNALEIKVALP